jgi:hypothetical protein
VKEDLRNKLRQKEMERQTKIYLSELRKKTLVDVRMASALDTPPK